MATKIKDGDTIQVVVDGIIERNKRWSFVDTDKQWFGMGFSRPKFNKGDTVQFDVDINESNGRAFMNVAKDTLTVVAKSEEEEKPKKTARASDVMSKDDYWQRKEANDIYTQREIRYQASRNAAIEFLELAFKVDALPLGTRKAVDKEELLLEYLSHYTNMFYTATFAVRDKSETAFGAEFVASDIDEEDDNALESIR